MSGVFDNKGIRITIKNFNKLSDHFGGLVNSFWTDDFVMVETSVFSKCDIFIVPYLP